MASNSKKNKKQFWTRFTAILLVALMAIGSITMTLYYIIQALMA